MTISIDFDGVIHSYSKGWYDGSIYDTPVADSLWALNTISYKEPVFIHTARSPKQVARWIEHESCHTIDCTTRLPRTWYGKRQTFWNVKSLILVTNLKFPARLYIDDRAYAFESWDDDLLKLLGVRKR
jgi:hypothetical protein